MKSFRSRIKNIGCYLTIFTLSSTILAGSYYYIDKYIKWSAKGIINSDYRINMIPGMRDDIKEIRLILDLINCDNPKYQQAIKSIETSKQKNE